MHELALAREIVAIIEQAASTQSIHRILSIRVALGAFGHVEESALRFAFLAAANDTIAAGAALEISRTAGQARCQECLNTVTLESRFSPCPRCGSVKLEVLSGSELRVVDMEVE